ncbi:MAG: hypothetical protein ACKOD2_04505 [Ilumatobacteraceae bacterium]
MNTTLPAPTTPGTSSNRLRSAAVRVPVATTVQFAEAARRLAQEVRSRGLVAPGFRCPPRLLGVDRSIRRWEGGAMVAVRLAGRPWVAVASDMIEGVVAANRLASPHSDRLRADLWELLGFVDDAVRVA